MSEPLYNPKIEIRETNGMGHGVFARRNIAKGAVIVTNPATPFYEAEWPGISQCKFGPYVFMNPDDYAKGKMNGFIAWGAITLVNHNDDFNAEVSTAKENGIMEAVLRASRPIMKGEQIFHKYVNAADAELYPWYQKSG